MTPADDTPTDAPPPATPLLRRGRWLWLVALLAGLFALRVGSPQSHTLVLDLGNERQSLRSLTISCADADEMSSGGRWEFSREAPPSIEHEVLTSGSELECELTLLGETQSVSTRRQIPEDARGVRLFLAPEIARLDRVPER